jgi:asparagine synthase (glutamine-hydrolyzing)
MCGIAGYVGRGTIPEARIEACLQRMRRRGPDHAGVWHRSLGGDRSVYLLNSRLRIIDLQDRSDQPFEAGPLTMTYNGELYNYRELASDLRGAGGAIDTTSDTEVLVGSIAQFGWDVLDRFEGMWAFAVHDARDQSVSLCRDRFGEKPLYVYRDRDGLYFGSEVKFLTALLGRDLRVNLEQLKRYMVNGYRSLYKTGETFFDGVSEIAPGSALRIDRDGAEVSRAFWRWSADVDVDMSYAEAVEGVRERLTRSVSLRLRADVPLAFCLSGGVDSNALAAIAARECGYDVRAFTIVDDDPRYDERPIVRESSRVLGIGDVELCLEKSNFLDGLQTLVCYHDAPVFTISYYAHWKLMDRIAHDGFRVAVSGTGADELFSGYYDHHLAYLFEIRDSDLYDAALTAWERRVKPYVRNPSLGNPNLFRTVPGFRDHLYFDSQHFAEYLVHPWQEAFVEQDLARDLLRNRMLNELFVETVPVILHEDDLNAMFFSIENRSPYLDRGLFEFCSRIPTRHLVRDGYAKAVLRDAVRGLVPDAVLHSERKVGFNASILSLLDVQDPAVRARLLADSPVFEHVRRDRIAELLDRRQLPNSESKFLFNFINAKLFLEQYGC